MFWNIENKFLSIYFLFQVGFSPLLELCIVFSEAQIWAILFRFEKLCVCVCVHMHAQSLNRVWLFATSWTVAQQAPLSIGFPRQEYSSGLPFTSRGSSWPRDQTHVSCIGRWILYHWAPGKALKEQRYMKKENLHVPIWYEHQKMKVLRRVIIKP